MEPEEYVIVLDTNVLHYNKEDDFSKLFNNSISDLKRFITRNKLKNVEICIPEIVFQERITQRTTQVVEMLKSLQDKSKVLDAFGVKIEGVPNEEEIRKKYSEFSDRIKKNIIVYPLPNPSISEIIKRSYLKVPPFESGGKGFKDTILWYSILQRCKGKRIVLVSDDGVFDKYSLGDEFKKNGGENLEVFKNIGDAKSFIRERFSIDENIGEIHEEIKNKIKKDINNILFSIVGEKYSSPFREESIAGFLVKEIIFKNISENFVFVDLAVRVKAKLFEIPRSKKEGISLWRKYNDILGDEEGEHSLWSLSRGYFLNSEKDLKINLRLHKMEDKYLIAEHSIEFDYGLDN